MRPLVLPSLALALALLAPAPAAASEGAASTEPVITCVAAPCPGPPGVDEVLAAGDAAAQAAAHARDGAFLAGAWAVEQARAAADETLAPCPEQLCRPDAVPPSQVHEAAARLTGPGQRYADWLVVAYVPEVEGQAGTFAGAALEGAGDASPSCLPRDCSPSEAAGMALACAPEPTCAVAAVAAVHATLCCSFWLSEEVLYPLLLSAVVLSVAVGDAITLKEATKSAVADTATAARDITGELPGHTCQARECDPTYRLEQVAQRIDEVVHPMHCMAVECEPGWHLERLLRCQTGAMEPCPGALLDEAQGLVARGAGS